MNKPLLTLVFALTAFFTFSQEHSHYSTDQVLFILQVKDANTLKPMSVDMEIKSESKGDSFHGKGKTDSKGQFQLNLVATGKVRIKLQEMYYMPFNEVIDFSENDYQAGDTVFKEFLMEKITVGQLITLDKIQFETGKSHLVPESYDQIDLLVMLMKSNPEMVIEISGHTDNTGGTKSSLKLSEDRVNEVKHVLIEKGVDKKHIKGEGYGGSKPIATNSTEEGRRKNRRVEFKILKNE